MGNLSRMIVNFQRSNQKLCYKYIHRAKHTIVRHVLLIKKISHPK